MIEYGVVLLLLVQISTCQLNPDEYIIQVDADCPNTPNDGPSTIIVTTDLPSSKPFAVCNNGEFLFTTNLLGRWELDVYFPSQNNSDECSFKQKSEEAYVYTISVYIPLSDKVLTVNIPEKIVSCIYDPMGEEVSEIQDLADSEKPVKQIEQHMAVATASRMEVCVADLTDECIKTSVRIGKKIKLKATLISNNANEQGFKPLSCTAIGIEYRYPLFVGGCGDGKLIPKNLGFITKGLVATSPLFKAFRLPGGTAVTYDCTFVVCSDRCDGTSCEPVARKKRDVLAVRNKYSSDTVRVSKERVASQMHAGNFDEAEGQLPINDNTLLDSLPEQNRIIDVPNQLDMQSKVSEIRKYGPNPTDDEPFYDGDSQANMLLVSPETMFILLLAAVTFVFIAVFVKLLCTFIFSGKKLKTIDEKERAFPQPKFM